MKARIVLNWPGDAHAFHTIILDGAPSCESVIELSISQAEAIAEALAEFKAKKGQAQCWLNAGRQAQ